MIHVDKVNFLDSIFVIIFNKAKKLLEAKLPNGTKITSQNLQEIVKQFLPRRVE